MYPIILAIDTSCDDTSVAVTQGAKVLSNIISSQNKIHAPYGGVMPLVAKLEHHKLINPTFKKALQTAKIKKNQIDAVAVTKGPGLAIALEVGILFAKKLAKELNKPLISVNHMKGHLFSIFAKNSQASPQIEIAKENFPALALLVSGGHSDLIFLKSLEKTKKIAQTLDDAAGECLDKFARLIDLGYPGASAMEKIAKNGNKKRYKFPLPMTQIKNFNYSFSGLKTAGRHQIEKLENLNKKGISDLAASFQYAVFRALLYKLKKAYQIYQPKSIYLAGGVSRNLELRKIIRKFCQQNQLIFIYPINPKLCTDNAAMIGLAAYFEYKNKNFVKNYKKFQRVPRLPFNA